MLYYFFVLLLYLVNLLMKVVIEVWFDVVVYGYLYGVFFEWVMSYVGGILVYFVVVDGLCFWSWLLFDIGEVVFLIF